MTQATKLHLLSKFDLFTPNTLHPGLPPLTSGLYTVMGSTATMLLERDVLNRKAHIQSLLGCAGDDKTKENMARRPAAHDRIIAHMGIYYCFKRGWCRMPGLNDTAMENLKIAKSMRTQEGRNEYVRKGLEKEWGLMGVETGKGKGRAREEVMVLD
jgi:hypothetical protein